MCLEPPLYKLILWQPSTQWNYRCASSLHFREIRCVHQGHQEKNVIRNWTYGEKNVIQFPFTLFSLPPLAVACRQLAATVLRSSFALACTGRNCCDGVQTFAKMQRGGGHPGVEEKGFHSFGTVSTMSHLLIFWRRLSSAPHSWPEARTAVTLITWLMCFLTTVGEQPEVVVIQRNVWHSK